MRTTLLKALVLSAAMTLLPLYGASGQAGVNAFGITKGQKASSLSVIKKIDALNYQISVPTPNPEFDMYIARVSPRSGVCRVSGIGKTHEDDRYGAATRAAFERLQGSLERKYGSFKNYDYLKAGSIWKDPQDFHMAILKKERSLTTFWDDEEGSNLPDGLDSIMLQANAVTSGPYVTVAYEFSNIGDCVAARQVQDDAGL